MVWFAMQCLKWINSTKIQRIDKMGEIFHTEAVSRYEQAAGDSPG